MCCKSNLTNRPLLSMLAALIFTAASFAATSGRLIYGFTGGVDGGDPATRLVFDASGNGYGTTVAGGTFGYGTVFELKRTSGGKFQEIVLHNFSGMPDGKNPYGGVTFDAAGNLYGTTVAGGNGGTCVGDGCGSVFELAPSGGGWTESVIYSFAGGTDGSGAGGGVVFDKSGNLFGMTPDGGTGSLGTIYELSLVSGQWQEKVIYNFTGGVDGGVGSLGLLLSDAAGNLFGVTEIGGASSSGTIFKLSPSGQTWQFTTLYAFRGQPDAGFPYGGLISDGAGNVYGTTYYGGASNAGAVFELDRKGKEHVLYSFHGGTDGSSPTSTLIFDHLGNLYGTTTAGGAASCDCGTVFEMKRMGGSWTEIVLHRFGAKSGDGEFPYYGMSADANGNFYSTTAAGGISGQGIVFAFTP